MLFELSLNKQVLKIIFFINSNYSINGSLFLLILYLQLVLFVFVLIFSFLCVYLHWYFAIVLNRLPYMLKINKFFLYFAVLRVNSQGKAPIIKNGKNGIIQQIW